MQIRFVADWHSCWIGFFCDPVLHRLYFLPLPMLGICFILGETSNCKSHLSSMLGRKATIVRKWLCWLLGHRMQAWALSKDSKEPLSLETCQRCGFTRRLCVECAAPESE